jgi:transcriptional regulator with XRE-family HTH domain
MYIPLEEERRMKESLGMRIKLARTRRGLNQAALARAIGISKNSMNLIERDLSNPAFMWVQKIAETLNVSLDYLGGRKEQDTETKPTAVAEIGV